MTVLKKIITEQADQYFKKFGVFVKANGLTKHEPATIGWKVTDITEFNKALAGFLASDLVNQCHIGFVDKRYIASIVFREPIYQKIYILKLMQRRPGSTDPVGLDHVDFTVADLPATEAEFTKSGVADWDYESNEVHTWISVRFNGTEAKFVDHVVLDVGVKELKDITKQLGFTPKTVK